MLQSKFYQYSLVVLALLLASSHRVSGQATEIINGNDTIYFNAQPDEEEFKILGEFYLKLNGKKWKNKKNWLKGKTSADMAKWFGIVVRDGDISEIHLDKNNLRGQLPKSIFKLRRLRALSIDGNNIDRPVASTRTALAETRCASTASTGKNLPVWGLSVTGDNFVQVDFRQSPPEVSELPDTGPSLMGPSGVALNDCGGMALYFLHSGIDRPNQLHIYRADGEKLTNDDPNSNLRGINSATGNIELQVVPVPGKSNEWFVIYSLLQQCYPSSNYCPAKVVWTKVKLTDGDLKIESADRDRPLTTDGNYINARYTQGKAVSRTGPTEASHYLYLVERTTSTAHIRIHRYIIDANGVRFDARNAKDIPAIYWPGGIPGSTVELSPDETKLAINNRNVGDHISEDLIVFDLNRFDDVNYFGRIISIPDLVIAGEERSIKEMALLEGKDCFRHIKHKIQQAEFSPSGRYLYVIHGGYVPGSARLAYDTYLLQIDLDAQTSDGSFYVRMQIEAGYGVDYDCLGPDGKLHMSQWTAQLQTAYDGNLYFSKVNDNKIYVIPNPDCPMKNSIEPGEIDLSYDSYRNLSVPNTRSFVFFPENIEGFNYIKGNPAIVSEFQFDNATVQVNQTATLTGPLAEANRYYQVAWGDGTVEEIQAGTLGSPVVKTHQYSAEGTYEVVLTVSDPQSCSSQSVHTLTVTPCGYFSNMTTSHQQYRCATKFRVSKVENCSARYFWNFGDGQTSTLREPMHVYAPGTWQPTLTVTFNCDGCRSSGPVAVAQVTVTDTPPSLTDQYIDITTEIKPEVLSSAASSFSDTWLLDHQETALEGLNEFVSGASGIWRSDGSFIYKKDRSSGAGNGAVNLKEDGTFDLYHFNWPSAYLNAVPYWIRANTMTRYNAYGYELENADVLNVHSSALYDYGGQLQSAYGVNMENTEMAFTGFETNTMSPTSNYVNKPSGNLIFAKGAFPRHEFFKVKNALGYVATVEAKLEDFEGVEKVDIVGRAFPFEIFPPFKIESKYVRDANVVCLEAHPGDPDKVILVFDNVPFEAIWMGEIRIKRKTVTDFKASIDNNVAHTGTRSLKITAGNENFEQRLLKLQGGKKYHFSAWVKTSMPDPTIPKLASGVGVELILKDRTAKTISITSMAAQGKIIEGWQQIKGSFTCDQSGLVLSMRLMTGAASEAWFDDVRLHPDDGNMKSYVYDLKDLRLSAILDENNYASMFYYDEEGNLYLTKKETEEGIKTITENISYQVGDHE